MPILSTGTRWNYQFRRVPFFYSLVIWYTYYNTTFRFIIGILPNLFNQYTNYTKKAPLCAGLFAIYKLCSLDCERWIVGFMSFSLVIRFISSCMRLLTSSILLAVWFTTGFGAVSVVLWVKVFDLLFTSFSMLLCWDAGLFFSLSGLYFYSKYPTSFTGSILMFFLIIFLNNIRRSSSISMLFCD